MHPLLRLVFTGAIMWLGFAATVAAADVASGAPPGGDPPLANTAPAAAGATISVAARLIPPNGRPIVLEANRGTLVRLARPASTVFVALPAELDKLVVESTEKWGKVIRAAGIKAE